MAADQRKLLRRLLVSTGIFVFSVVSMVACLNVNGLNVLFRFTLAVISLPLVPVSAIVLIVVVWRGVSVHGMAKMDAWWWLSAPFSAAFPLSALVFRIHEADELVMVLAMLALMTTALSIAWLLATLYVLTISKKITLGRQCATMMAVVLLACALWAAAAG
jgi:hypothetical protein